MIVHTQSGTTYEFQRYRDSWEGQRHSFARRLQFPVNHWTPVLIVEAPVVGKTMHVHFEGKPPFITTAVEWMQQTDEEKRFLEDDAAAEARKRVEQQAQRDRYADWREEQAILDS
jgi:hypothetical protein